MADGHVKELELNQFTLVLATEVKGITAMTSPKSNLPLRGGKGWMYEGGIREPMMVRWPGVTKPGSVNDTPVTSTDFFPTIMEMAGLKPQLPLPIDGVSFTTALRGKPQDRGALYWHYPHYGNQGNAPTAAVREGDPQGHHERAEDAAADHQLRERAQRLSLIHI